MNGLAQQSYKPVTAAARPESVFLLSGKSPALLVCRCFINVTIHQNKSEQRRKA